MAFSELELKRIDRTVGDLCRRAWPPEYASEARCVYDIEGHSISIFEERPPWDGRPGEWTRAGVAKFRFFRSRGEWTLYWMRSDLKWHIFEPEPPRRDLATLVKVVDENRYGAFFG